VAQIWSAAVPRETRSSDAGWTIAVSVALRVAEI